MNHKNLDIIFFSHEVLKQLETLSEEKNKHKNIIQQISIIYDELESIKFSNYSIRCQIAYRKAYSFIRKNRDSLIELCDFIKKEVAFIATLDHGFKPLKEQYDMLMATYGFPSRWTEANAIFESYSAFDDKVISVKPLKAMMFFYVGFWSSVSKLILRHEKSMNEIREFMKDNNLDSHEIVYKELSCFGYAITNKPGSYYYEAIVPMHNRVYRFYHPNIADLINSHSCDELFQFAIKRAKEQSEKSFLM